MKKTYGGRACRNASSFENIGARNFVEVEAGAIRIKVRFIHSDKFDEKKT